MQQRRTDFQLSVALTVVFLRVHANCYLMAIKSLPTHYVMIRNPAASRGALEVRSLAGLLLNGCQYGAHSFRDLGTCTGTPLHQHTIEEHLELELQRTSPDDMPYLDRTPNPLQHP